MDWLVYKKIWIYDRPIDFRKQMDGLVCIIESEQNRKKQADKKQVDNGDMYVFQNRQKNKLKLLMWDRNGYFMGYKRLEKGRFDFPVTEDGSVVITKDELQDIVSGMPIVRIESMKKTIFQH